MFEKPVEAPMSQESKIGELKGLENTISELKKTCIEIESLSQDLNNLIIAGDTTRPEEVENKERERGKDRIIESQLKMMDCMSILNESKRLLNLLKEKFE